MIFFYKPNDSISSKIERISKNRYSAYFNRNNIDFRNHADIKSAFVEFLSQVHLPMDKHDDFYINIYSDINKLFYINPQNKNIYCTQDPPNKTISIKKFMSFIRNHLAIKDKIDSKSAFLTLKTLLLRIEKHQIIGYPLNRYLHNKNIPYISEILSNPYTYFAKIDKIFCLCQSTPLPLTLQNFKALKMPIKMQQKYLKALNASILPQNKDLISVEIFNTDSKPNCIFYYQSDGKINYIQFKSGKFEIHRFLDERLFSTHLPAQFTSGEYNFSEPAKDFLRKFFHNEKTLNTFSKFVATAYTNQSLYKKALIIYANDKIHNESLYFLQKLFAFNAANMSCIQFNKKLKDIYTYLLNIIFSKLNAYIIDAFDIPKNLDLLRKLIKSTNLKVNDKVAGTLTFKNTIPVIFLTRDENIAKELKKQINSEITTLDEDLSFDKLNDDDYINLRKALALYGLRLLSPDYIKTHTDAIVDIAEQPISDKQIISSFVNLFCKKDPDCVTRKSELRDAFSEYVSKLYPHFIPKSIAICNYLRDKGYDCTRKKRVNGEKNPVYIISELKFDKNAFDEYLTQFETTTNTLNDSSSFDVMEKFNSVILDNTIIFDI